jgi:hypothetical protein
MKRFIFLTFFIYCFQIIPSFSAVTENGPLFDETESPEIIIAKNYFQTLFPSNYFNRNYGTIGNGNGGIINSYKYFSSEYQSKVTPEEYLSSFENIGDFRLLQLYSAGPGGASGVSLIGKCVYFELNLVEDAEKIENKLFLGAETPRNSGGSKKTFYGFIYFTDEAGQLKISEIKYFPEFPCGGGHSMGRQDPIEVAQSALPELSNDENQDTENIACETQMIHPDHLVYVTCTNKTGAKRIAKLAHPSDAGDEGWICIQIK